MIDHDAMEGCACGEAHVPGAYSWNWLADVIRAAGVKVVEQSGWQTRGHGNVGDCLGIICHHTAGPDAPRGGDMPSLNVVMHGRPDLAGPLCNVALGRDGTVYIVAAGLAWHAGPGRWKGHTGGNSNFIGIEAENAGDGKDPWSAVQMDAYHKICAAILDHAEAETIMCAGHKEFALPAGRKTDPDFDMNAFRAAVQGLRK